MEPIIERKAQHNKIVEPVSLVTNSNIPRIYANGVQTQIGIADANLIFQLHDTPIAMVSIGLPLLKSLRDTIDTLVKGYESNFNTKIDSLQEILDRQKLNTDQQKP